MREETSPPESHSTICAPTKPPFSLVTVNSLCSSAVGPARETNHRPHPPKNIHGECLSFGKNALSEGKSFQEASVIGAHLGEPPPGGRPQRGQVPSCLQVMLLCWDQTRGQLLRLTQPQAGIWATPQPSAPKLPLPEKALV